MKEISVKELKEKLDRGEDLQIIDVREPHEADICSIDGELIPMGQVLENTDKIRKDVPVVIHCRSGGRSASVVEALERKEGLENLYNLKGDILAWADEVDPSMEKY